MNEQIDELTARIEKLREARERLEAEREELIRQRSALMREHAAVLIGQSEFAERKFEEIARNDLTVLRHILPD